jgi:hypothetical protein
MYRIASSSLNQPKSSYKRADSSTEPKETKQPVILVTDDAKTDWWLEVGGKKIGPRPELAQEMHEKAGVRFHLYRSSEFIKQVVKDSEPGKAKVVEAVKQLERVEPGKRVLWQKLYLQTELRRVIDYLRLSPEMSTAERLQSLVEMGLITPEFRKDFLDVHRGLQAAQNTRGDLIVSFETVQPLVERTVELIAELRAIRTRL